MITWKIVKQHEHKIGLFAIIVGFVWDSFFLIRPDQLFGNIVLISYLLISAFSIIPLTTFGDRAKIVPTILLIAVQFAFGNLASGLLVIYGHSGTFAENYLFLILLGGFIIRNEFLREKYAVINFNISLWYFFLLSYVVFALPILLGKLGDSIFVLSGAISLIIAVLFVAVFYLLNPKKVSDSLRKTTGTIIFVFLIFNLFYFLNIVPPVPISLSKIGIYHNLTRLDDVNYHAEYEKPKWYQFLRDTGEIFTKAENEKAYCFTSVYAPVKLSTPIYHKWEYYENGAGEWQTSLLVNFSITGGRDDGYRGYSEKSDLAAGRWRCSVVTETGALIGRTTFDVTDKKIPPILLEKIL